MYAQAHAPHASSIAAVNEVRERSEIDREMNALHSGLETLWANLEALKARIAPVTQPMPAQDGKTAPMPVCGSQIGQGLQSAAGKVGEVNREVSLLIASLAL